MQIENKRQISDKYIDKFELCKLCGSKPIIENYFDDVSSDFYSYIVCPNHSNNKIYFNNHLERMYQVWNRLQTTVLNDFIESHFSVKNFTKEQIANVVAYFSESWFIKYSTDMIYVFDNEHNLKYVFKNYEQFKNTVTDIEKDKYE